MQGFDEHLFAHAGLAVNQQRNVFFQQALGLAHGFFHAHIAKMQGLKVDRRRCWRRLAEHPRLHRHLLGPLQQALEPIASRRLQGEGQPFRLVEQLQQRDLEQAVDHHPREADAQQVIRTPIGREHLAAFIKDQQAGPLAVEVAQAGVEGQLEMFAAKQVEDQPVLHGLAHHLDHAQGV